MQKFFIQIRPKFDLALFALANQAWDYFFIILINRKKMKNTELQQSQTLPDNIFLTFLETAIKNAAEPILTKLFEDSHRNQMNREMGEEPIDIDEAALLIKKKKNTVYKYCSQNTIIFHKSGNKTLFYRSELLEWLKSKRN